MGKISDREVWYGMTFPSKVLLLLSLLILTVLPILKVLGTGLDSVSSVERFYS